MTKRAMLLGALCALSLIGCNSSSSELTADNTVGGANVVSAIPTPMTHATTSLSLDWGSKTKAGQVAIADVLSYSGAKPKISAPEGWQFIRDDSSLTTRQSLYWHAIQANDPRTAVWTFSDPVDAQGAIVVLDNANSSSPVDLSSGNSDTSGTLNAKSVATTGDGNLILIFYATDFHAPGLDPKMPANTSTVLDLETASHEYWILSAYQASSGPSGDKPCGQGQLFSWVAAQVAIERSAATPAPD